MPRHIFKLKKRPAETLIEVLMAIFVVALGSAAATSLVINALQTNGVTRDSLLALNLATEGIEAMRNMRDSNWIKYAYDKENCWNMRADYDICQDTYLISNSAFGLKLDTTTLKWTLLTVGATPTFDLNLSSGAGFNEFYRLAYKDMDPLVNSDGEGGLTDDRDILVSAQTAPPLVGNSKFYRMISVVYPTGDPASDQDMTVTSLVQWKDRGTVHQVKLVSKLTNYAKVKVK